MRDGHDVHVAEFGTALTPIAMGENLVTTDLRSGMDLRRAPVYRQSVRPASVLSPARGRIDFLPDVL